jgi:hypothetical protein
MAGDTLASELRAQISKLIAATSDASSALSAAQQTKTSAADVGRQEQDARFVAMLHDQRVDLERDEARLDRWATELGQGPARRVEYEAKVFAEWDEKEQSEVEEVAKLEKLSAFLHARRSVRS